MKLKNLLCVFTSILSGSGGHKNQAKENNDILLLRNICWDPLLSYQFFYVAEWQHGNYLIYINIYLDSVVAFERPIVGFA